MKRMWNRLRLLVYLSKKKNNELALQTRISRVQNRRTGQFAFLVRDITFQIKVSMSRIIVVIQSNRDDNAIYFQFNIAIPKNLNANSKSAHKFITLKNCTHINGFPKNFWKLIALRITIKVKYIQPLEKSIDNCVYICLLIKFTSTDWMSTIIIPLQSLFHVSNTLLEFCLSHNFYSSISLVQKLI